MQLNITSKLPNHLYVYHVFVLHCPEYAVGCGTPAGGELPAVPV